MRGTQRGWLLVIVLTVLALLFALLLSIFFPDANGLRPAGGGSNFRPPVPLGGNGRDRGAPVFFSLFEELNGFWRYLAQLVSLLGSGLIILFFLPRLLGEAASLLRSGGSVLLRAAVVGLVGSGVVIALFALAASSIAGLAIAALGLVLLLPFVVIGATIAALAMGRTIAALLIHMDAPSPFSDLLTGLLVVFILLIIPVVGFWLLLLISVVGMGSLLLMRSGDNRAAFDEMEY